jgi:RNA polymerase sigma-70 factor (ECF subfamily)
MNADAQVWADLTDRVGRYMRGRVSDEHTAADLAQDVMLKARAALSSAPPDDKLAAWLFHIARNTLTDHYRSPRNRGHVALDDAQEPSAPAIEADVLRDLTACLRPMIEKLDAPDREALELAELGGLTQQALAERLGISLSGAKSRVQRARAKLKALLLDCCHIEVSPRGGVTDVTRTTRSADYCGPDVCPGK